VAIRLCHARHDQQGELAQLQPQGLPGRCSHHREGAPVIYVTLVIAPPIAFWLFTKAANFIVSKFERASWQ